MVIKVIEFFLHINMYFLGVKMSETLKAKIHYFRSLV